MAKARDESAYGTGHTGGNRQKATSAETMVFAHPASPPTIFIIKRGSNGCRRVRVHPGAPIEPDLDL